MTRAGALQRVAMATTVACRGAIIAGVILAGSAKRWRAGNHWPPSPDVEAWVPDNALRFRDDKSPWGWRRRIVGPLAVAVLSFVRSGVIAGSASGVASV